MTAGQRVSDVVFQLAPMGAIEGRVFDENGEPSARVMVEALAYQSSNGLRSFRSLGAQFTNDLGEYRIFWLPPGEYLISAPAPVPPIGQFAPPAGEFYPRSYYPGEIDPDRATIVSLGASAEVRAIDFSIRSTPAVKITGKVTLSEAAASVREPGQTVIYTQIALVRSELSKAERPPFARDGGATGNVGVDGAFEFTKVLPGSYALLAWLHQDGGIVSGRTSIDIVDRDVENIVLSLVEGSSFASKRLRPGQA
jgi:hypothetical protein